VQAEGPSFTLRLPPASVNAFQIQLA